MERNTNSGGGFRFPPGFRFHPSDEELIIHYLQNKATSRPLPASIMAELDLYKYNPWELPRKALFGEDEWFFFSPRDRKYPNGVRPNRAAGSGYWKATGTDKPIVSSSGSKKIGVKKALVFYTGKPPKGVKTDWIMNEYRLLDTAINKPSRLKGSMRLDDWVLCRVRHKGNISTHTYNNQEELGRDTGNTEETCPTYNTVQNNMIIDYLSKDCTILSSILSGENLPSIDTISCISFQESKGNSLNSVYEEAIDKMSSPVTVSSFENYNPLKRKIMEVDNNGSFLQSKKKPNSGDCSNDLLPAGEILSENGENYYDQNCSQDGLYNPCSSYSIIDFLETSELPFNAKYFQ
ncbi:hypothetical protein K2173_016555 [Erythroxylum novogranatense]|uniref:NAC domain-containing protein n=1 Tax=Erythroxylum novogranatense TaxID=1862640 RepID=A0AAV8SGI6_9ROSI|nr:hypothetical protein K2173_016555 [Erythroxylum novogranatense]